MKKKLLFVFVAAVLLITAFSGCAKTKELTTVKLNEVTHSVFYAPQYLAIALGYFAEEGLEIELTNGGGADKTVAAVLSGDADIGLCGPEATIYVYNQGQHDYVVNFAQLTQCDGSFVLAREETADFTIEDFRGKHIIAGRKGGMPVNVLEWILKQNGLIPGIDVTVDTSVAFNAMSGAFIGGNGDFVSLFEPTATALVRQGYGYVVMSLGTESGTIPYTVYNAKESYIESNPEIIESFCRAIKKAQQFTAENSAETIAEAIIDFFPDTSMNDLVSAIESYKSINAYATDITLTEESFNHLQDIIDEAGELTERVDYGTLVYTEYMN